MTKSNKRAPTKPIKRQHIAQVVFEELSREILEGAWPAGEPLASERALAEQYGVSRLLVRQAMHRLAAIGLVHVRQGGSTIVQDPAEVDHPDVSVLALRFSPDRERLFNQLRARQIMGSMSLLMLAARTLNESDFDYLESLLHRTGKEAEERMSELFWVALADATSNQFFQRDTRFWFRVVRQEIGVDPDADIDVAVRRAVYLQLVTDLREKKDPYIAYKPFVEQLMERMEAADSR